jgi:hypothetical protein
MPGRLAQKQGKLDIIVVDHLLYCNQEMRKLFLINIEPGVLSHEHMTSFDLVELLTLALSGMCGENLFVGYPLLLAIDQILHDCFKRESPVHPPSDVVGQHDVPLAPLIGILGDF